jgi:prepilin-type N-terminal cleavage/methylation domain-containing protein
MMKESGNGGFTLIELLIVIAIVLILIAIALPNFLSASARARVVRAQADMKSLSTVLESYQVDHREYPYLYLCRWETEQVPPVPEYGSWEQNRWELKVLTTPIEYVVSIPQDIFSDEGEWPYDYVSFKAFVKVNFNMGNSEEFTRWMIRSRGPDKIMEPHSTYCPTNGTLSRGDLNRYGSGRAEGGI